MRRGGPQRVVGLAIAIVLTGLLGVAAAAHAADGSIRILIPGAFASPSGTSADGQVTLQIGVGLPVFQVNAAGAPVGGSIATVTFARWTDTVLTPDIGTLSTLMVFRLPDGLMVIAAGVQTPDGLASSFSATDPYSSLTGNWDITVGQTAGDALVTFTYDTNPHIKETGLLRFVAVNDLSSIQTKAIPALATVDTVRNIAVFDVTAGNAKGVAIGNLAGHTAASITGHAGEFVELKVIRMVQANLYLLYGCAAPAGSGVTCLVGGTGFATHLSGGIGQIPGALRKDVISGVTDADLVIELNAQFP